MNNKLKYISSYLFKVNRGLGCLRHCSSSKNKEIEFNKFESCENHDQHSIGTAHQLKVDQEVDFFGFFRAEGVFNVEERSDSATPEIDVNKILEPDPSRERIYEANFGFIRYDDDNIPLVHGQFEVETLEESDASDTAYTPDHGWHGAESSSFNLDDKESHAGEPITPARAQSQVIHFDPSPSDTMAKSSAEVSDSTNIIEDLPEGKQRRDVCGSGQEIKQKPNENNLLDVDSEQSNADCIDHSFQTEIHKPVTKYEQKRIDYKPPDIENPKTAFDYVMKLRKEGEVDNEASKKREGGFLLDSKGFRIYQEQVKDCGKFSKELVLHVLKDSILYNEHEILALYKPYGLAVQGTEGDQSRISLLNVLPNLADVLNKGEKLYTSHRIDRETTGIILLAKTQYMAKQLQALFETRKIQKSYYGITSGVPEMKEGVIDIPISEGTIEGKKRMYLRPLLNEDTKLVMRKSKVKTHEAITKYKVVTEHGNAALVQFFPETGVRHQIRVHTGFGLSCPILGDHKYSHLRKLAPQKLPGDLLDNLKVRQTKVRHIPMHLHSRSVMIPEINQGKNIFIQARLPPYFMKNLSSLKMNILKRKRTR